MEQLYHVIHNVHTNSIHSKIFIITELLLNDRIGWSNKQYHGNGRDNGIAFNIFECKRLIELAKQEDSLSTFDIEYTYKIIPANID